MRNVNFIRAGMENFCCHIDPMEIVFTNDKLTTICGPNGVGKTAIFQSIPYTLYGICEKGKAEDVLNDKTQKNCHTFVEFDIDGDLFRVDRYVKYTKIGNTVTITKNGGKPYKKGQREVVPEVEKLLMPRTLFTNTLLFSQKVKTFFTDLTDSEQKEIFRKILKLEMFVNYFKKAGVMVKETEELINKMMVDLQISDSLRIEILASIKEQQDLKTKFATDQTNDLKAFAESKRTSLAQLEAEKIKLDHFTDMNIFEKLATTTEKFSMITEKLSSMNEVLDKKLKDIDLGKRVKEGEFENRAKESKADLNEKRRVVEDSLRKIHKGKRDVLVSERQDISETEIAVIESNAASKRTQLQFIKKEEEMFIIDPSLKETKKCPVCMQDITEDCFKQFDEERAKRVGEAEKIQAELKILLERLTSANEKRSEIDKKVIALDKELETELTNISTNTLNDITTIDTRLTLGKRKLNDLANEEISKARNASIIENEELLSQKSEIEKEKKDLEKLVEGVALIQKEITSIEMRIKNIDENAEKRASEVFNDESLINYEARLVTIDEQKKELQENIESLRKKLDGLNFWYDGFSSSGIQSMLIDDAIPFMNDTVSSYLSELSQGRYTVSFDTMSTTKAGEFRDKISVNVFDNITHANARVKLSGGQERIVDVATILTLADLQSNVQNIKFNILLFDEIFDALDDENINGVARLLRIVARDKSMFIISHRHIDSIESDEELMFH